MTDIRPHTPLPKEEVQIKLEWANKRCQLKGEPLTETQREYLMFVFSQ